MSADSHQEQLAPRRNDDDRPVPIGINAAIPSPARMYDHYLGECFL